MGEVSFFVENVDLPSFFSEDRITHWITRITNNYRVVQGDICYIFCDDEYILEMNRQYLSHDYYTDVITFDYTEDQLISGDIFISLDTVLTNSEKFQTTYEEEFFRVVCHGLLHLIGFKDKTQSDSDNMRKNEDLCLNLLKTTK